jgi:murein DD-endopeptidase MepM/ murein hydrolase activator NlpD
MRFLLRLSTAVLTVLLVTPLLLQSASAQSSTERQRQIEAERRQLQEKIRQADQKAKTISGEIATNSTRKSAVERDISRLTTAIKLAEDKIARAEADLGSARDELFTVEGVLALTLKRLDEMEKRVSRRAAATYKQGTGVYVEMLLSADDFRSFVNRLTFVRSVISEDRARLQAVERLSEQMTRSREEITKKKDDITAQKTVIEQEKQAVARQKSELQAARQQLNGLISQGQQNLKQVQGEKADYLRAMDQLRRESSSIAAMLRSRQKGQTLLAGGTKRLAWPCTGSVVSPYGYRTHPIFLDSRLHAGIDISCKSGAPVSAAEGGTVIWSGTRSGYGLTVIIDHGGALATLYAHLSSVSVGNGARVGRGQSVGAVGCTGYCTGAHLHFETRVNGEPVDPMQFYR